MPILSYFVGVGSVLIALLFVADATLAKRDTPIVATSSIYGLPKPWKPDPAKIAAVTPAPAPDMTSAAVQAAMPKAEPVKEQRAQADVAPKKPKKRHIARRQPRPADHDYRQNYAWSPDASRPFGGGGFFGRF